MDCEQIGKARARDKALTRAAARGADAVTRLDRAISRGYPSWFWRQASFRHDLADQVAESSIVRITTPAIDLPAQAMTKTR